MKKGFTLAEVLITLGIIGVVAVLTIPPLVQNHRKTVAETRLKRFYSMINQAVQLSELDHGPQDTWSYNLDAIKDEDGNNVYDAERMADKFDEYLAPYMKIIKKDELEVPREMGDDTLVYYLADGSSILVGKAQNRELVYITENPQKCLKKRQSYGTCLFMFSFIPDTGNLHFGDTYKHNVSNGVQPFLFTWDGNDESLWTDKTYGCNNGGAGQQGLFCTEIIRRNGWKIPDNYPYKF